MESCCYRRLLSSPNRPGAGLSRREQRKRQRQRARDRDTATRAGCLCARASATLLYPLLTDKTIDNRGMMGHKNELIFCIQLSLWLPGWLLGLPKYPEGIKRMVTNGPFSFWIATKFRLYLSHTLPFLCVLTSLLSFIVFFFAKNPQFRLQVSSNGGLSPQCRGTVNINGRILDSVSRGSHRGLDEVSRLIPLQSSPFGSLGTELIDNAFRLDSIEKQSEIVGPRVSQPHSPRRLKTSGDLPKRCPQPRNNDEATNMAISSSQPPFPFII